MASRQQDISDTRAPTESLLAPVDNSLRPPTGAPNQLLTEQDVEERLAKTIEPPDGGSDFLFIFA